MICRTQVAVQSTNSAMAALLMWPDESMTILALRLLTALRRCLFKRRSLTFSKGRKGRTLIVSFMMHLQVKVAKNSTWRCFTLLGAHQLSVTLPILPSRPYFNESCQLKTAVPFETPILCVDIGQVLQVFRFACDHDPLGTEVARWLSFDV